MATAHLPHSPPFWRRHRLTKQLQLGNGEFLDRCQEKLPVPQPGPRPIILPSLLSPPQAQTPKIWGALGTEILSTWININMCKNLVASPWDRKPTLSCFSYTWLCWGQSRFLLEVYFSRTASLCTSPAPAGVTLGPFCTPMRSHQEHSFKDLTCIRLGLGEKHFIPGCKCRKQVNISCLLKGKMGTWTFLKIWFVFQCKFLVMLWLMEKITWTGIENLVTSILLLGLRIQKKTVASLSRARNLKAVSDCEFVSERCVFCGGGGGGEGGTIPKVLSSSHSFHNPSTT